MGTNIWRQADKRSLLIFLTLGEIMTEFQTLCGNIDVVDFLTFLIAVLSALYARWAWSEAKRSNEISLSTQRKDIYDAFFELKMHMTQKAEYADAVEVSKFYRPSKNAKFFFKKDLAAKISEYFDACFNIGDIHRRNPQHTTTSLDACKPHLDKESEFSKVIDVEITDLISATNS